MSPIRGLAGLAALGFALLHGTPANAFAIMKTGNGKELHWVASEMPIPFHIESGPSNVRDGSDEDAMVAGFDEWQRPACSYISFQRVDSTGRTGGHACGGPRNTLAWVETGWPRELGRAVVAVTMTCFEPGGSIIGARILFNGQDHEWATDGRTTAMDVGNVATHEIGHFIGIGHSEVHGTTMWPTTSNGDISQRHLHRDDLEALCYLYPRGQPWAPGNSGDPFGPARDAAGRLGVDRAGGCEGDATGAGAATAVLLIAGLIVMGGNRRKWRHAARV